MKKKKGGGGLASERRGVPFDRGIHPVIHSSACISVVVHGLLEQPRVWGTEVGSCAVQIYLMGNRNELRDHVLRYTVFSAVWVFQIKDHFWMEHSQYTGVFRLLLHARCAGEDCCLQPTCSV